MTNFFVGLISGTSMDGIDAVVVSFSDARVTVHATHTHDYPPKLKHDLLEAIRQPLDRSIDVDGVLDRVVGEHFREAANEVIKKSGISPGDIVAIGSHGQTLRHQPNATPPFSLQVGDAALIAAGTAITTVYDFRTADIAAGGQGAPLVPPFHQWLFAHPDETRIVVNIGGIANVTILPHDGTAVSGYDTGPGNGLMDAWIRQHQDLPYDERGQWAAQGQVQPSLLQDFLNDPYFKQQPPKSTGFEYYNINWLQQFSVDALSAIDVQATLCDLTAISIANAIEHCTNVTSIFVCGGGARNSHLMQRLQHHLGARSLKTTAQMGLDPDWVEAVAFAWLAMKTLRGEPGNLPSVTGASHEVVLGNIHCP